MGPPDQERFAAEQRAYFAEADVARFLWQTHQPYVAERERALLPPIEASAEKPSLEVGCGEGANLYHLVQRPGGAGKTWVGVDLFFPKVLHAARQVPALRGVCADGHRLPFPDGRFHHVLARDLFHHILDKAGLMAELRRVCAAGGRISIIEGNGRNPIVWMFGLLHPAERGQRTMRSEVILRALGPEAGAAQVEFLEPIPLYRILFHYRYGFPRLARSARMCRAVAAVERWLGRILPRSRWAYFRATLHVSPNA